MPHSLQGYPLRESPGYHGYRHVNMFNVYFGYLFTMYHYVTFFLVKIKKVLFPEISLHKDFGTLN